MRLTYPLAAVTVCSTLLLSASAGAQYSRESNEWPQDRGLTERQRWLVDRQYREGAGFRVGDFELHPGIGADFGYDSNFLRRNGSDIDQRIGSLVLRVSPHFSVATLGPQRRNDGARPDVTFRFGSGLTYYEFIPIEPSDQDPDIRALKIYLQGSRNVTADAKFTVGIMPGRTWSGRLYGGASRTMDPSNIADRTASFNRITPQAGAELVWAPGSGVLDWHLGYNFSGTFFESANLAGINNMRNEITTRGRWRFLPRTALMFDARAGFITYLQGGGEINKQDSHPLRARLGVNGLITQSFAAMALVGWGASFYSRSNAPQVQVDNTVDYDSVIGQAEIKWFFNPARDDSTIAQTSASMRSLAVGFIRDFNDAYIGTYFERDMGYARFTYLFGSTFLLSAEASAGAVVYPDLTESAAPGDASDNRRVKPGWADFRLDSKLFGEYRIMDSVGITAEVGFQGYFSDQFLRTGVRNTETNQEIVDPLDFRRFRATLGARWFM